MGRLTLAIILTMTLTNSWASCYDTAYNQAELNHCASGEAADARTQMQEVISQVRERYRDDEVFIKALMRSQVLFEQSLEADTYLKYPNRDPNAYGSVYPMCLSSFQASLIEQRIAFLQVWLDGIEEGDVCSGSVRFPP